jgi:hypothetical protein
VFAAGDVTTVPYKQIVIAVGEGAKASLAAFDHLIRLRRRRKPVPASSRGKPARTAAATCPAIALVWQWLS